MRDTSLAHEAQTVPPDVATYIREHRLMDLDAAYTTARVILTLGIYAALAVLAFWVDQLVVWCVVWIAMGLLMLAAPAAMHEGAHRLLYRTRWLNDLVGSAAGAVLFMPFEVYRRLHVAHHRNVSTPEDPEPPRVIYSNLRQYILAYVASAPFILGFFWWHGLRTVAGRPALFMRLKGARRAAILNLLVLSVGFGGLIVATFAWPGLLLHLYWAPLVFATVVLVPLVTKPEHYGCRPGPDTAFATTRTTTSNAILRFCYWNSNHHAAHHLHPQVPCRHLPELHELIKERCEFVEPSFIGWHARLAGGLLRRAFGR